MIETGTYLGEFWNPNISDSYKYIGALKVSEQGAMELEIHQKEENYCTTHYEGYDVLWGIIGDDYPVTLFNVRFRKSQGLSSVSFSIGYVFAGRHVASLDNALFRKCIVKFPYLKNWVCTHRTRIDYEKKEVCLIVNKTNISQPLVDAVLEKGLRFSINEDCLLNQLPQSLYTEISQDARCEFVSEDVKSINNFINLIKEFAQFFSIALYCRQYPNEIKIIDIDGKEYELLFSLSASIKPIQNYLIPFYKLQEKVPQLLVNWHTQFQQVAPICRSLLQSTRYCTFDFPDFLIIAQALDGYHKRFVNKKNGKDIRKYEDGIKVLLEQFKDVEAIKNCEIDTGVLTQSRDKYSHLIPDDDSKITKAVSGKDLYALTNKCKVLLTCCILHLLGLDIDDINLCFERCSVIKLMAQND